MKQAYIKHIVLIICLLLPLAANCQIDTMSTLGGKPVKEKKIKPDTLNTYAFDHLDKNAVSFSWHVNPYFNTPELTPINDTLPNDVRVEYPTFKKDVGAIFLGTTGSASMPIDFFKRKRNENFKFFEPYADYVFCPENVPFYNTKRPFTVLSYQLSGNKIKEESNLRVLHTQNIRPEWNIGLLYQYHGTKGLYQNQATDNKSFNIFSGYTGKRYVAHGAYMFTNINNRENGGILDDNDITDTIIDSEEIRVRLPMARNRLKKHTLFFTHSLGIPINFSAKQDTNKNKEQALGEGTLIFLGNSLEYTKYTRQYTDMLHDATYYNDSYLNPLSSRDSSNTIFFDAKVFARIQPWASDAIISNISGGLGYQNQHFYAFFPNQYLENKKDPVLRNTYIYANAGGKLSKYFEWTGFSRYFITGKNDFLIDAKMRISFFPIDGGIHLGGRFLFEYFEPNFFNKNYYSNRIKWDNNFDNIVRTQIEGNLSIPKWDLNIGVKQSILNNYVYHDNNAIPQQYNSNLSVSSLSVKNNLKLGLFHFDNELLFQISSNQNVLPLPKVSAHLTWYLQAVLVHKVLTGQFGIDARINTKYYAYAYNPAAGDFHTQSEKKIGNFPYADVFMNLKWKRTTIFVKLSNIAKNYFGSEYFSALHYPRNNSMLLRLGLTWHFFN